MQVGAISSNNYQSFGQKAKQKPIEQDNRYSQIEKLIMFADMDDKALQKAAVEINDKTISDKKARRTSNLIWGSMPLVAGLGSAIGQGSRLAKLKAFGATSLLWAGGIAFIDAFYAGTRAIENKIAPARKFNQNHPTMSFLLHSAAAFAALVGGIRVLPKALAKLPKIVSKKQTFKLARGLENNKVLNTISKGLSKTPAFIKSAAKTLIPFGPMMLLGADILNTSRHAIKKNKEIVNTYNQLKNEQQVVRQAIAEEIQKEYEKEAAEAVAQDV